MRLKIDKNTKLTDIIYYVDLLSEDDINKILSKINFDFGSLKISYFCEILEKGEEMFTIVNSNAMKNNNAFEFFAWTYGFNKFITYLYDEIDRFKIPVSQELTRAEGGVPPLSITENIYAFLQNFYNCKSIAEIEALTITDYFFSKKVYNRQAIVEHNLSNIYKNKIKN